LFYLVTPWKIPLALHSAIMSNKRCHKALVLKSQAGRTRQGCVITAQAEGQACDNIRCDEHQQRRAALAAGVTVLRSQLRNSSLPNPHDKQVGSVPLVLRIFVLTFYKTASARRFRSLSKHPGI
jgi:hypothetical protein